MNPETCVYVKHHDAGTLRVTGPDSIDFLNRMLSNDIKTPAENTRTESAFLTANGKVRAYMTVWKIASQTLLVTQPGETVRLKEMLESFIIADDVTLEIADASYSLFELAGKGVPEIKESADGCLYQIYSYLNQAFAQALVPNERISVFNKIMTDHRVENISPDQYEVLRIERGKPLPGKEITEEVLLPETTLEKISASETKGCYPGQEVVAKIETYGRLNRKLMGFLSDELPEAGSKIYDADKEVGWITSSCYSDTLRKNIALGYVAKGYFEAGLKLISASGQKKTGIVTSELPIVRS